VEEKKNDLPEETGKEMVTPAQLEAQLSSLVQQLASQLEAGAQAESQRKEMLDSREADLKKREMNAKVREELEKRGLPIQLSHGLAFAAPEEMEEGIDALEARFRAAVQQGVEARLLIDAPKAAPIKPLSEMTDEDYYAAIYRREI